MKTVLGIDYGTQSARAILVDAATGEVLTSKSYAYPHGVMPGDLACAHDYDQALKVLLEAVVAWDGGASLAGICVDATSLTLVPLNAQGRPLATERDLETSEHAQIKLWKRHNAQPYADRALSLAVEMNEPFLRQTGGALPCEWMLPKLLETREEAPEVYARMDTAMDLCEYITYALIGAPTRSAAPMRYKALWSAEHGFPTDAYLNALAPGFADEYKRLMRGPIVAPGVPAGALKREWCEALGIDHEVTVSAGAIDGQTCAAALGALREGDVALTVGTSNVMVLQSKTFLPLNEVCGISPDVMAPGLYGVEAGQGCTGDMLEWYIENALPRELRQAAECAGHGVHEVLCARVVRPWANRVAAPDWWNGSRNLPSDLRQRGVIAGLTMETKPEEIYLALLQAIVCGTRELMDYCAENGMEARCIRVTGGIAGKNPLLMQEYANILQREIHVGMNAEGSALGAAVYAAVAAGLYPDVWQACDHIACKEFVTYTPDAAHAAEYKALYQRNHMLRQMIAQWNRTCVEMSDDVKER